MIHFTYKNFNPKQLVFDLKVREQCKTCKRYGKKATCPPYVDTIDYYKTILKKYSCGILVVLPWVSGKKEDWKETGSVSSLTLANEIRKIRDKLIGEGHYYCIGLGAGSCKICSECSFPCRNPNKSLVSIEATGIDIKKTLWYIYPELKLNFPIKEIFIE